MNNSYSFTKSIKDKQQKISSYYKKINNVEQTKIFVVPKRKKGTKKNISRIINKKTNNKTQNKLQTHMQEYTLEDVAKHNKKTDAWIVIGNKVANITKWIPKHPGGDIIMKGVGKDATKLFNSIDSHNDYARKMVKKYQIGILKK